MKSFNSYVRSRDSKLNEMARFYEKDIDAQDVSRLKSIVQDSLAKIKEVENVINIAVDTNNDNIKYMSLYEYNNRRAEYNKKANADATGYFIWADAKRQSGHEDSLNYLDVGEFRGYLENSNSNLESRTTLFSGLNSGLKMMKDFYFDLFHKKSERDDDGISGPKTLRKIAQDAEFLESKLNMLKTYLNEFLTKIG